MYKTYTIIFLLFRTDVCLLFSFDDKNFYKLRLRFIRNRIHVKTFKNIYWYSFNHL